MQNTENIEVKRFYEKLNKDAKTHHLLEATPYSSDPKLNFIGEDLFFNYFFSESEQATEAKKEFEDIDLQYKQIALCLGYKGCGKSTFAHWLIRGKDQVILDFDEFIKSSTTIHENIAGALIEMILSDYCESGTVLDTFLDIFCFDKRNHDAIIKKYPLSNIHGFFDICMDFATATINSEPKDNVIARQLHTCDLQELLVLLVFWQLARKTVDLSLNKKTYILFDNLDVVRSSEDLEVFLQSFAELMNNVIWAMQENIWYAKWEGIVESNCHVFQNFVFIFSLRETTYSKVSTHTRSRVFKRPDLFYADVSTMFQRNDFVIKRRKFLENHVERLPTGNGKRLLRGVRRIDDLLADKYFWGNVFPLFNNDYRTIIDALVTAIEHWDDFDKALELLKTDRSVKHYQTLRYGGRCAFLRKIFDVFAQPSQDYFERIESRGVSIEQDANGKRVNMSLAHLLLCYLYDEVDAESLRIDEYRLDKRSVSLRTLFDYFQSFVRLDDVVSILYGMYELRGSDYWSHPVTFDNLGSIALDDLMRFLDQYRSNQNESDVAEPRVRITCAGRLCLKDLFVRFEYFAARSREGSTTKPLFLCTTKISVGADYEFISLINAVYEEVKKCYYDYETYYREVVKGKLDWNLHRYLQSKLSYRSNRKRRETRTYVYEGGFSQVLHSEQVVFSCFGYIEFFRSYFINTISDVSEKRIANELLVEVSKKFLALISEASTQKKVVSDSATSILNELFGCIAIIEQSEYYDFTTRIETKKGIIARDG